MDEAPEPPADVAAAMVAASWARSSGSCWKVNELVMSSRSRPGFSGAGRFLSAGRESGGQAGAELLCGE